MRSFWQTAAVAVAVVLLAAAPAVADHQGKSTRVVGGDVPGAGLGLGHDTCGAPARKADAAVVALRFQDWDGAPISSGLAQVYDHRYRFLEATEFTQAAQFALKQDGCYFTELYVEGEFWASKQLFTPSSATHTFDVPHRAPRITAFSADKDEAAPGEVVTFRATVDNPRERLAAYLRLDMVVDGVATFIVQPFVLTAEGVTPVAATWPVPAHVAGATVARATVWAKLPNAFNPTSHWDPVTVTVTPGFGTVAATLAGAQAFKVVLYDRAYNELAQGDATTGAVTIPNVPNGRVIYEIYTPEGLVDSGFIVVRADVTNALAASVAYPRVTGPTVTAGQLRGDLVSDHYRDLVVRVDATPQGGEASTVVDPFTLPALGRTKVRAALADSEAGPFTVETFARIDGKWVRTAVTSA